MKSRKPVKRSRKCPRGIRKSDGKCKRKPGPKRSRKMKRSRRRTSKKLTKTVRRSRKCVRGKRKSDGKCRRKPGPKRSRKMKSNKRYKFRVNGDIFDRELSDANIKIAINLWFRDEDKAIRRYGHISEWNVSNVNDMSVLFNKDAPHFRGMDDDTATKIQQFNADISTKEVPIYRHGTKWSHFIAWDVSNVTNMYGMFSKASTFNGDISNWNVSNVTDMSEMFDGCERFDRDLSKWDVSNVTDMAGMFDGCERFNGDLSKWDVSKVTDMSEMFDGCERFNGNICDWDIRKVSSDAGKEEIQDMINRCKAERKRRIEKRMTKKQVVTKFFKGHVVLSNEITKFLFR